MTLTLSLPFLLSISSLAQIYYYLEDDTISVVEPEQPNSGMPQGKLIKRQRLPKDELGNTWHWKVRGAGCGVLI